MLRRAKFSSTQMWSIIFPWVMSNLLRRFWMRAETQTGDILIRFPEFPNELSPQIADSFLRQRHDDSCMEDRDLLSLPSRLPATSLWAFRILLNKIYSSLSVHCMMRRHSTLSP